MAVQSYAGATASKLAVALGKGCAISATTFVLTLGTAVLVVVAGALIIKEIANIEILNDKNPKTGRASETQQ